MQQLPPPAHEGFQPMYPDSSGGFKPIFNPFNDSYSTENYNSQSVSQESLHKNSEWDFPGNSLPHTTMSKVKSTKSYILYYSIVKHNNC